MGARQLVVAQLAVALAQIGQLARFAAYEAAHGRQRFVDGALRGAFHHVQRLVQIREGAVGVPQALGQRRLAGEKRLR